MKHLFVINPRSFPVQTVRTRVEKEIQDCFSALDVGEFTILSSRYPRDAIGLIRKWIKEHPTDEVVRVYAVGGDGILFDCLNGIVGLPKTELASIPYGTSNDVIRAFGEDKKDLFRDIKLQVSSGTVPIDIIHCGNNYALNFCTLGLESDAIMIASRLYNSVPEKLKKYQNLNRFIYGALFYLGGVKAVFNSQVLNQYYKITIDGEDFSGVYGAINIANGPCYGGNKSAVPTAMPNDGFLDALFFRCNSSLKTASIIPRFVKGEFRRFPEYFFFKRFKNINIRSDLPLLVDLDGEAFFDTSLTVQIIPKAVNFTNPAGITFFKRDSIDE